MPIEKVVFRPGIVKEATNYANEGGWFDGNRVRFRAGLPESIGGWTKVLADRQFLGTCRSLHDWVGLDKSRFLSLGTHLKFYILWGGEYYDITPIRAIHTPLTADPFLLEANGVLQVTDSGHGATLNDFVIFSGATTGITGSALITAAVLNREYQIIEILDANHYRIQSIDDPANIGQVGGGAAVKAEYQIASGLDEAIVGNGWGAGPWGGVGSIPTVGWGDPYPGASSGFVPYNQIRLWSQDNYGEDLIFNIREGPIYYWVKSLGVDDRGKELKDMPGANQPPQVAMFIFMSESDRHVVAVGTNEEGTPSILDPLLVRWSDQEDALDWEPRRDNSAGALRLSSGSAAQAAIRTRQENLIWTDKNLHSMRFIGTPYTFSITLISESVSIISPNAAVNASDRVWWMDRNCFYVYSGQMAELPCSVRDYVFSDINFEQGLKIHGGHNHNFQEVMWFYPSRASSEIDRYVMYNYVEQVWSIGTLERTAWLDLTWGTNPVAASDGWLYYHDLGTDADGDPLASWIQSADLDLGDGDNFMFVNRVLPDVHFRGPGNSQAVGLTLKHRKAPGAPYITKGRKEVTQATVYCWMRARGRQFALRVESDSLGTAWRFGVPRFEMQPDGKR
ncbi:MAG: hypothetical protein ABWY12_09725 [Burkholderiales bacterium]